MNETEFQGKVIEAAHTFGWAVAHFRPAMTKHGWRTPVAADGKGFPDLVLVSPEGGVLWRELKVPPNTLTDDQIVWRDRLLAAGADWALWVPDDWAHEIVPTLSLGRAVISS